MTMMLSVLGLLVGLVVLTVAADMFVVGAARTATHLQISPVVIGAVIIGIGTSAPEMVVSGLAAAGGNLDIAVGNVIGSNLANVSLVLGVAALTATLTVQGSTIRREAPLSVASVVLFGVLVQGGLQRWEGLVLLAVLVVVLTWVLQAARTEGNEELGSEVDEYLSDGEISLGRELGRALVGLVATIGSAQLLVWSALDIAESLGLAAGFVGLTIVAIGTSLPELATSLQAARKNETDLIIGNLLGSNIFNSLAVGGLAALVGPATIDDTALTGIATGLMIGVAVLAALFMRSGRRVTRSEGLVLLAVYLAVMPLTA